MSFVILGEHPDAIIPDLATNSIAKFSKDDVALVYGSLWKQRYFTKRGDDYFPEPAQWECDASRLASIFCRQGNGLVGAVLSSGQYAAAHGSDL